MGEGRKREVRRMCAAVGHPVERLVRTAIGPLRDPELRRRAPAGRSPSRRCGRSTRPPAAYGKMRPHPNEGSVTDLTIVSLRGGLHLRRQCRCPATSRCPTAP